MRSAVPQKLRSGKASRKSVMNALMSSRPRRGSCSEYCRSMSGAASSSTMPRLQVLPQKSVNQRPTMALLSSSLDMANSSSVGIDEEMRVASPLERYRDESPSALRFLRRNEATRGLDSCLLYTSDAA